MKDHSGVVFNLYPNSILQDKRSEYKDLSFQDMLSEINDSNIEYIMTKPLLNMFLESIHHKVTASYNVQSDKLDNHTLITFYFGTLNDIDKIYNCHQHLIDVLTN